MKKFKATGLKRITKRLEIRPMQLRDNRAWAAAHCAMLPPKNPWDEPKRPMSQLSHKAYCKILDRHKEQIESDQSYPLGIFHREASCLLGHITLKAINRSQHGSTTLDFRVFNIHWGKGFAKEAVAEVLKLAKHLKLAKVEIAKESRSKVKL